MSSALSDAIRGLAQDKGISEELIHRTIEEFLLAAYKKTFGNSDNAVVRFGDEEGDVTLFAQKRIVEDVYDPVTEIELEEALELNDECEVGDELLIEVNPQEFDRTAIQSAKQRAKQTLREIQKDTLYSEFKDKVGEMIIGYYQRERNGNIFVDLGKTEGILPKRYQSPREVYRPNDRIKALIYEVNKAATGLQIVLSRTHTEFVRRVFELEVPEIYDKTVEVYKIVREPGYRTKIAVYSNREDVDPVGACVGMRGVRIQAIVRELEGEKIDILKFDTNVPEFIRNALSPAEVSQVVILDEGKKQALAIVPESQLSLAIGKQGLNVRLANRLADWNIDVKTEAQFGEMDVVAGSKRAVSQLFGDYDGEEDEITTVAELPDIPEHVVEALKEQGVEMIEDLVALGESGLKEVEALSNEDVELVQQIVADNIEIIEGEEGAELASEDEAEAEPEPEEPAPKTASERARERIAAAEREAAEAGVSLEDDEPEAEAEPAAEIEQPDDEAEEQEITEIGELPNISDKIVTALERHGVVDIVDLLGLEEADLRRIEGLDEDDVAQIREIISDSVEVIEQDDDDEDEGVSS